MEKRATPKVKILTWKICRNALATQINMARRDMATSNLCQICRQEAEDTFHVFMRCPYARSLWLAMKEVWDLLNDDIIRPTDAEWLLRSLNEIIENHRVSMMITLWRIWHNHNAIMHEKPCPSIEGSRRFLMSYLNSLLIIKKFPAASVEKGKMVVDQTIGFHSKHASGEGQQRSKKTWKAPFTTGKSAFSVCRPVAVGRRTALKPMP
jgi:hypothetical protein